MLSEGLKRISANAKSSGTMPTALSTLCQGFSSPNFLFAMYFPPITMPTGFYIGSLILGYYFGRHHWLLNKHSFVHD